MLTNELFNALSNETLMFEDIIRFSLINMLDTAMTVSVTRVEEGVVYVRPLYKNTSVYGNILTTEEELETKPIFPYNITFPINAGDKGVLIALKFDNQTWDTDEEPQTLSSLRKFSFSNSVFLPMTKLEIPENFIITYGNNSIEITETDINVNADVQVNINAPLVNLGEGGLPIARLGDEVTVGSVKGTITGSGVNTSL